MKYLLTIVLLFPFSQAAAFSFWTGSKLLENCEAYLSKTNVAIGNTCAGYVMGIDDTHRTFTKWGEMSPLWCSPDNMKTNQLVRVVTKHLREQPEKLHLTASSAVANALMFAFPCE